MRFTGESYTASFKALMLFDARRGPLLTPKPGEITGPPPRRRTSLVFLCSSCCAAWEVLGSPGLQLTSLLCPLCRSSEVSRLSDDQRTQLLAAGLIPLQRVCSRTATRYSYGYGCPFCGMVWTRTAYGQLGNPVCPNCGPVFPRWDGTGATAGVIA